MFKHILYTWVLPIEALHSDFIFTHSSVSKILTFAFTHLADTFVLIEDTLIDTPPFSSVCELTKYWITGAPSNFCLKLWHHYIFRLNYLKYSFRWTAITRLRLVTATAVLRSSDICRRQKADGWSASVWNDAKSTMASCCPSVLSNISVSKMLKTTLCLVLMNTALNMAELYYITVSTMVWVHCFRIL